MDKVIREGAARVGVDLAKRVIQVHAVDPGDRVLTNRMLVRDKFLEWARKLVLLGLDARIISAQLVAPYRRQGAGGKNDANDAQAICEAAARPQMHFVPIKSIEQQSMLCVHRLREGIKQDRTACISRTRGLLAEFGWVFAQGPSHLEDVLSETRPS